MFDNLHNCQLDCHIADADADAKLASWATTMAISLPSPPANVIV